MFLGTYTSLAYSELSACNKIFAIVISFALYTNYITKVSQVMAHLHNLT